MERYTYWCDDGNGGGEWRVNTICGKEQRGPHVDRLAAIEDILGDNYDLDCLRELVEADRVGLYLAELEKKAGKAAWISVEDQLPERFRPVIVCRKDGRVESGQKDVGDWWRVYGTRIKTVSYWMPLPKPPKEVCSHDVQSK